MNDEIYPRFYSLHDMQEHIGIKDERGRLPLPPMMQLSAERLARHGLFLIASVTDMYLFVCEQIHPQLLRDVFGVDNYQDLPGDMVSRCLGQVDGRTEPP